MKSQQNLQRFTNTKNWSYTQTDTQAQPLFANIITSARKYMPPTVYTPFVMTHYNQMQQHQLYSLMKTIPKGVLHHCHIDCCEDKEYYKNFIINDPLIYLNAQLTQFHLGTAKQAEQQNWVSMVKLREKYQTQEQMVDFVSSITMFNEEDNRKIASKQVKFWSIFDKKIVSFFSILFALHQFKSYMKYICQKFIKNGYDRLEFRSMIAELTEYDSQGNVVKVHPDRKYIEVLDQVQAQIKQTHPSFSLGVIFFGLKMFSSQQNQDIFTKICELNWNKTLGFDLVQEEDPYGSLQPYDDIVTKVLAKYPHLNYKKVYHAGQTNDPTNTNIKIALDAGSVRIGHGINIIQHMEILHEFKNVCFEVNHISNILTGLRDDTRISSAAILMGLGYPVTISCDDPGKFGYEDTTVDYFSSIISFNWGLKELKLLAIHSINHAICDEKEKQVLIESFNQRWNSWVNDLLKQ